MKSSVAYDSLALSNGHSAADSTVSLVSPGSPAIRAVGLTKRYGSRTVVDRLDLEIPQGAVAGFVGPNGAGKTTTLRMLLGLVRPTCGEAQVLGISIADPHVYLPRVGALIESPAFYPGLSGARNLAVLTTLAGFDPAQIPMLLDRVGLGDRGSAPFRTYSLGMKQRLGIAAALLGDPRLLILDEPGNGLDPSGIRQMRELLRSLADGGRTILVSSHQLAEVQQVCDWLIVIDKGRRIFEGPTRQLLEHGGDELVLACEPGSDLPRLQALLSRRGLPSIRTGDRLRVGLNDLIATSDTEGVTRVIADINQAAANEHLVLVELSVQRQTLEESFLNLTGGA
jgi:ABC-2 type transport system ATP-binding protein